MSQKLSELIPDDDNPRKPNRVSQDKNNKDVELAESGAQVNSLLLTEASIEQLLEEFTSRHTHVVAIGKRAMSREFDEDGHRSLTSVGIKGDPSTTVGLARTLFNLAEERAMCYAPPVVDYGMDDDFSDEEDD